MVRPALVPIRALEITDHRRGRVERVGWVLYPFPRSVAPPFLRVSADNLIACMDLAVRRQDYGAPLATIRAVHAANIAALVPGRGPLTRGTA